MEFHPIENSQDTANIVVPILIDMYKPNSVLDLGCNIGCWLKAFEDNGVTSNIGIDGDNMVGKSVFNHIGFIPHDLTTDLNLHIKFDLVLCLEVAEHLEEKYADTLIDTAIRHSDTIIWCAAIIGQGGYNHVNEQPHRYWIDKFKAKGYGAMMLTNFIPDLPHNYYKTNMIEFKKIKHG